MSGASRLPIRTPRLVKRHGIWGCWSIRPWAVGYGYEPKEAYREWKQRRDAAALPAEQLKRKP